MTTKGKTKGKGGQTTTNTTHETAAPAAPATVTQLGYKGELETLDAKLHSHKIVCACGNERWVAPGDLFQVHECKPCVARRRKDKRNEKAKGKRAIASIGKLEARLAAAKAKAGMAA